MLTVFSATHFSNGTKRENTNAPGTNAVEDSSAANNKSVVVDQQDYSPQEIEWHAIDNELMSIHQAIRLLEMEAPVEDPDTSL
jgi:hypothetical protein